MAVSPRHDFSYLHPPKEEASISTAGGNRKKNWALGRRCQAASPVSEQTTVWCLCEAESGSRVAAVGSQNKVHFALRKRALSPARHVLEDTSHQTRPKIDAGDASLLMESIN
jgi:hypothetical protein